MKYFLSISLSPVWRQVFYLSQSYPSPGTSPIFPTAHCGPLWPMASRHDPLPACIPVVAVLEAQMCSYMLLAEEDIGTCPWHSHLLFTQHRLGVPYCGLTTQLGLKASNLFYLSQNKYRHPIPWLLSICKQVFIVLFYHFKWVLTQKISNLLNHFPEL